MNFLAENISCPSLKILCIGTYLCWQDQPERSWGWKMFTDCSPKLPKSRPLYRRRAMDHTNQNLNLSISYQLWRTTLSSQKQGQRPYICPFQDEAEELVKNVSTTWYQFWHGLIITAGLKESWDLQLMLECCQLGKNAFLDCMYQNHPASLPVVHIGWGNRGAVTQKICFLPSR